MYNYTITRLSYWPILCLMFSGGICAGSLVVLFFGLAERDTGSLITAMVVGLLCGCISAFIGVVYTMVFNILAPSLGGIPIHLEANPDNQEEV